MTPAEFIYAYIAWADIEQSRTRQAWECERWAVWVLTSIQLEKKDRLSITDMFPLPWEEASSTFDNRELSMQERVQRVNLILNRK